VTVHRRVLPRVLVPLLLAGLLGLLSACSDDPPAVDEDRVVLSPAEEGTGHTHSGAAGTARVGDGTTPQAGGYRLADVTLPAPGAPGDVSFRVLDRAGRPLTSYTQEQTKDLHLYVVRNDLAQFRHLHPTLAADGTWTGRVALATPGSYRVIAEFTPGTGSEGTHVALGDTVLVPGAWEPVAVAADTAGEVADDGVVAVDAPDELATGPDERMTLEVSGVDGQRVALGSYLGTFAHLTGFDVKTGAFVHAHPYGAAEPVAGGDELTFHTEFTQPGTFRFFLQVRIDGFLHQVPFTATVS
jgi:hypothetical protein